MAPIRPGQIAVDGGVKSPAEPAARGDGTRVELRDLFYAVPARLKFLKSPRSESNAAQEIVERLAMAHPDVAFTLRDEERLALRLPAIGADLLQDPAAATLERLGAIMGRDFADNAARLDAMRESVRLTGFAGLPTLNRATSTQQFLFVNGRPVKDRLIIGAIRGAYQDFLARDRHPMVALFVDLPAEEVDVNVHPAKAEVRFRDAALVRGLIVSAIRAALAEAGHRASSTVAANTLGSFTAPTQFPTQLSTPAWRGYTPGPGHSSLARSSPAWPRRRWPPSRRCRRKSTGPARASKRCRPRTARLPRIRSALRARNCTRPTWWRRPPTAS